ncbi:MFS transporter [Aspergillus luchuensis]|uniref:MFS transporter n=1 Tax=Aspergillus kawachii TaxID=1069201 RepID=A0A146F2G1_ASPKA|nr:MFS transporter [Aspergillus luchuensis]
MSCSSIASDSLSSKIPVTGIDEELRQILGAHNLHKIKLSSGVHAASRVLVPWTCDIFYVLTQRE